MTFEADFSFAGRVEGFKTGHAPGCTDALWVTLMKQGKRWQRAPPCRGRQQDRLQPSLLQLCSRLHLLSFLETVSKQATGQRSAVSNFFGPALSQNSTVCRFGAREGFKHNTQKVLAVLPEGGRFVPSWRKLRNRRHLRTEARPYFRRNANPVSLF